MSFSYKDEFIYQVNSLYARDVEKMKAIEVANLFIKGYFTSLYSDIKETLSVPGQNLKFYEYENTYNLVFSNSYFKVIYGGEKIKVYVSDLGSGYEDEIKLEGNTFISSKYNQDLSVELLDIYLKDAFENLLKLNLK
jgi:hypothetical protein